MDLVVHDAGTVSDGSDSNTVPPPQNWRYANFFQVAVTGQEVVIDFAQHFEGSEEPHWHTRIVLSPVYAQELLGVLSRALNVPIRPPLH